MFYRGPPGQRPLSRSNSSLRSQRLLDAFHATAPADREAIVGYVTDALAAL